MPVYNQEELVLRAIKSVPNREDIELIIVDDCSTDNTYQVLKKIPNIILLHNEQRIRAGNSINRGIEIARGEYILQLDSDDYLISDKLEKILDIADCDLVFFNMQINDGSIWSPNTDKSMCDHTCLYKRTIIGDSRLANTIRAAGWYFHQDIIKKPHTERYTNELVYMYNYPHEGSTLDLYSKGLLV